MPAVNCRNFCGIADNLKTRNYNITTDVYWSTHNSSNISTWGSGLDGISNRLTTQGIPAEEVRGEAGGAGVPFSSSPTDVPDSFSSSFAVSSLTSSTFFMVILHSEFTPLTHVQFIFYGTGKVPNK